MDRLDIDPLQIPLIICNIFKFLPFEEKKKWRALSRFFHDETLKSWSKSIVFTLDESLPEQNGRVLNKVISNESGKKDSKEEMQLREVPISNFRLVNSQRVLPEYSPQYLPDPRWDFALFLERSGKSLRSLHIEVTFRQDRFVDYFKLLLFKYCKNLKELSISSYVVMDKNPEQRFFDGEQIPEVAEGLESLAVRFCRSKIADTKAAEIEVCKGILSFFPNIKRLKVGGDGLTKMLTPLPSPLHSPVKNGTPRFILLNDLEIDAEDEELRDLVVYAFRTLRIYVKKAKPELKRLKYINFNLDSIRCPPYYFHQFISDCKFTLTRFQMNFVGSSYSPLTCWISDLSGIDFQNLTHLILVEEGRSYQNYTNYAARFDFRALRGMKKLKVFRCIAKAMASPFGTPLQAGDLEFNSELEGEFDWARQVAARNKVDLGRDADPPLLKELEEFSFFLRGRLTTKAVRQLGKWMPSVRKLGLIADRTLFPVLFEVWDKSLDKVVLLGPTDVSEEMIEETTQGKNVEVEVLGDAECYAKFNEKIF